MTDYIKRESRTFIEIADDLNDLLTELNDKIVESIMAKTADVAPVRHGRWVEHEDEEDTVHAHCSECGWEAHYYETDIVDEANYCPNCGARMDGGEE